MIDGQEFQGFIKYGGIWDRPARERFCAIVEAILSDNKVPDDIAAPPGFGTMVEAIALRRYGELCDEIPGVAPLFKKAVLDAARSLDADIRGGDEAGNLLSEIVGDAELSTGDTLALLEKTSAIVGDTDALRWIAGKLGSEELEADRASLSRKAVADMRAVLSEYSGLYVKRFVDDAADSYLSTLDTRYEAIKSIRKRIAPFKGYLGRFWDMSDGEWSVSMWQTLAELAEALERAPGLRDLIEQLGRLKAAERAADDEALSRAIPVPSWKVREYGKSEITGLRFSDDISSLLPCELSLLASPGTELVFLKRFAEKTLLCLDYSDEARFDDPEPPTVLARKTAGKKGPVILCIDTSGSMHGAPETAAKTIAFAALKKALSQDRACYLISFSTAIKTLDLTGMKHGLGALVEFLRMSFHGGTDAGPALQEAVRLSFENEWKAADILVVSDFIMPSPGPDVLQKIAESKERGTRFSSLVIMDSAHEGALAFFDDRWVYDGVDCIRTCCSKL